MKIGTTKYFLVQSEGTFAHIFHIDQEMNFWTLLDVRDSFKDCKKGRINSEDNGMIPLIINNTINN